MSEEPKISVLTASKNGGKYLRQTIESVMAQNYKNWEHVIVDSQSTDDTLDILREYKHIRWISEPDRHTDDGFYKALSMARGEYIMFICVSDGYSDPGWFRDCVEILDSDPEVSMVHGLGRFIDEEGLPLDNPRHFLLEHPPPQKREFFPYWLGTFCLCLELTFCVRADVFRRCFPRFEPTGYFMQNHAVFGFNYNFNRNGYLPVFLPKLACYGRRHGDSNSVKIRDFNGRMKNQYKSAIMKYGNELFTGVAEHVFRDGNSNIIGKLDSSGLDACRKKVLHYRINRRFYLGKKDAGIIRRWSRKLRILILYYLLGRRVYS